MSDLKKESDVEKQLDGDSPLKKLIKIFRTNTVIKHHFQGGGVRKAEGVASIFLKNSNSWNNSVIPGYTAYERFSRYSDYAEMMSYPIINKALQVFADEATQKDEDGKIIKISSESKKIEDLLQDLMDNVLQLNGKKIYKIVRDMCKYGDTFYLIDITTDNGVCNLIQMPANEVEREEGFDKDEPTAVRFKWNRREAREIPNAFVAHFRLDGDDLFHPYGQCLKWDTRIYTTSGIKLIKDIKKNDKLLVFDEKSQKYIESKVLNIVSSGNKKCLNIRSLHNFIEASKEHKIYVFDYDKNEFIYKFADQVKIGDSLVIKKNHLIDNKIKVWKNFNSFNKNGYQNTKNNLPDYVDEEFAQLLGFLIGDGWINKTNVFFTLGEDESINEKYISILKKYSEKEGIKRKNKKRNSTVLNTKQEYGSIVFGSKMLSEVLINMGFDGNVYSKRIPSWIFECSENIKKAFCQGLFDAGGSVFKDKWNCSRFTLELANEQLIKDFKVLIQTLGYKSGKIGSRIRDSYPFKSRQKSYYINYFESKLNQVKKRDTNKRLNDDFVLEPIVSISEEGIHEVYDIFVENKNHNFIANGIVVHNSVLEGARRPWRQLVLLEDAMMVYRITRSAERRAYYFDVMGIPPENIEEAVKEIDKELKKKKVVNEEGKIDLRFGAALDVSEDIIVPVRGKDSATRIDTLPGGQNIGDIEDVEFIKKNLFAALGIPKAFLTFDEGIGAKQVLTMEDVRFARTISKVQEAIVSELVKICLIHLYIKGIRGRDLINFKIKMTNPSTVAEMQKNELWRSRMDLIQAAGQGVFDTTFIYKQFLRLSDDAIDLIRKGQIQDKIFQAKLLSIESAGGQMGAGGLGGMGGLGGGMGMGGMSGLGGGMGGMPPVDLGGAPPNVVGTPPLPESMNPAAGIMTNNKTGTDLNRTEDERLATKRGQAEDPIISIKDIENSIDNTFDISGIERIITSPSGISKESKNQEIGYTVMHANAIDYRDLVGYLEVNLPDTQKDSDILTETLDKEFDLLSEKVKNVL